MAERHTANAAGRVCLSATHAAALRDYLIRYQTAEAEAAAASKAGDIDALRRTDIQRQVVASQVVGYLEGCFKAAGLLG